MYLVTQVIVLGAVLYHTYPQGTESVITQTSDISVYPPFMFPSLGYHVTVADGGHGDEGPPQAQGNGRKVVVGIGLECKSSRVPLINDSSFLRTSVFKYTVFQSRPLNFLLSCLAVKYFFPFYGLA